MKDIRFSVLGWFSAILGLLGGGAIFLYVYKCHSDWLFRGCAYFYWLIPAGIISVLSLIVGIYFLYDFFPKLFDLIKKKH
jgi:hypothetical protein